MTSKPENFILNTDFPTLKNDATGTVSVTVPASITIVANDYWQSTSDIVIGTKGSIIKSTIKSTRDNVERVTRNLFEAVAGSSPAGSTYNVIVDLYRISPTTIRMSVYIPNLIYPAATLVTSATPETITCKIATFLSPFNT